ncbi:MAG: hypothetical protein Q9218_004671, partial [Villophora microphyllina]
MSRGIREFLENRGSLSADDDILQNSEQNERMHARLRKMGINRSLSGNQEGDFGENAENRPLSRQEIADRSRVPTPVFNPHRPGFNRHSRDPRPQAGLQAKPSTQTTDSRQVPFHPSAHPKVKTLGPFDTDTEGLDDTTGFSGFTDPVVAVPELRNGSTGRNRMEAATNNFGTAQATPKPRPAQLNNFVASPRSNHLADPGADQYADDEFDDQSQFDDFITNEGGKWNGYDPMGPAPLAHQLSMVDEVTSDQTVHSPKPLLGSQKSGFLGDLPHDPHILSSTRTSSVSSDGRRSALKRDGHSQALNLDNQPMLSVHMSGRSLDVPRNRDGESPLQNSDPSNASTDLKRKLNVKKPQPDLDYDPKTLAKMSFQQLAEESFDTSPQTIQLKDRSLTNASSLEEKLLYLHSLD